MDATRSSRADAAVHDPRCPAQAAHPSRRVGRSGRARSSATWSMAEGASVWPFSVRARRSGQLRPLGRNSNVQDNSVLHVTPRIPCIVGEGVTIGHRCVVHALHHHGNNVRIGIGAVVLTGAVVEDGAQVGAGALVPQGKVVPAGWLVMGVPAKPIRQMSDERDSRTSGGTPVDYLELWQRDYRGNASRWGMTR